MKNFKLPRVRLLSGLKYKEGKKKIDLLSYNKKNHTNESNSP